MPVQGQVDGLEGSYVVGWAAPGPGGVTRTITVHDETGRKIAAGRASRYRADLVSLRLDSADFAFRLPVRHKRTMRRLHVRADDVELHNSPIELGPDRFDSGVEISHGFVHGWLAARTPDFTPPTVTVRLADGRIVGTGRTTSSRSDDPLFAPARFRIPLDQVCFGCGPVTLACAIGEHVFARLDADLRLKGSLEIITPERCAGWIMSPDAPARRFTLSITRDDLPPRRHPCEVPRPDVVDVIPEIEDSRVGFDLTLPPLADPSLLATISVRLDGADHLLFDSPTVVAGRPALVRTVRRATQLLHDSAGQLDTAERSLLQSLLGGLIADSRARPAGLSARHRIVAALTPIRATVIIPVYRDVTVTCLCIDSVLEHRDPARDRLLIVEDRSPDRDMAAVLDAYTSHPNVIVRHNEANRGFIGSVNRALTDADCAGDVVLLNSDTRVFAGWLDELHRVAHASASIGTVTAMSNNATIFSYPHMTLREEPVQDITLEELAALALRCNAGVTIDVPTGHGFCLFIKGEVVGQVGLLDEGFGRGYGEENDFCARAADLGFRHVAAAGVLVEHKESVSFTGDKTELLRRNLRILEERYPEYSPTIMAFEQSEGLRRARWPLDAARLKRAGLQQPFVITVMHGLGGGTAKAAADIAEAAGLDAYRDITIRAGRQGAVELRCADPVVSAIFAPAESATLFDILGQLPVSLLIVHQTLGFEPGFLDGLETLAGRTNSVFYAHDFYPVCPRVTMINAVGAFCDVATADTCVRCVAMGGAHESSRLPLADVSGHRASYDRLLRAFRTVIAPSEDAAVYYRRAFPALPVSGIYHPEDLADVPDQPRRGSLTDILILGAIGPHKGSRQLLEIASQARLSHPELTFHVIGHTDIDAQLAQVGNVVITGQYEPGELDRLVDESDGCIALFLQVWPETYSYTLSEAVRLGLIPVVPDIGAPAERVRRSGYGIVYPFPIRAGDVTALLESFVAAGPDAAAFQASPRSLARWSATAEQLRSTLLTSRN